MVDFNYQPQLMRSAGFRTNHQQAVLDEPGHGKLICMKLLPLTGGVFFKYTTKKHVFFGCFLCFGKGVQGSKKDVGV